VPRETIRPRYRRFTERPTSFLGAAVIGVTRLKLYSVARVGEFFDRVRFDSALRQLALEAIPATPGPGRPRLGFAILDQGEAHDRIIVAWWDREHELPLRVFVRDGGTWRGARPDESLCVWDLEVLWFERCAYVETILGPTVTGAVSRYLARHLAD